MSSKKRLVLRFYFRGQECYGCGGNIELELVNNAGPQELRLIYEAVAQLNQAVRQTFLDKKTIEVEIEEAACPSK